MGQEIECLGTLILTINLTMLAGMVEYRRTIIRLAVSEAFLQGFDRRGCLRLSDKARSKSYRIIQSLRPPW